MAPTPWWTRGTPSSVWEPGKHTPIYAFPRQDVRLDASADLAAATREFDDPDLDGYVTLAWDALEHWYEEDEEVFVHPRDPFVRVDALRSSRHIRVERDGQVLAESDAPILVFETGAPTRYYLPEDDVDASLLDPERPGDRMPVQGVRHLPRRHGRGPAPSEPVLVLPHPLREAREVAGYLGALQRAGGPDRRRRAAGSPGRAARPQARQADRRARAMSLTGGPFPGRSASFLGEWGVSHGGWSSRWRRADASPGRPRRTGSRRPRASA